MRAWSSWVALKVEPLEKCTFFPHYGWGLPPCQQEVTSGKVQAYYRRVEVDVFCMRWNAEWTQMRGSAKTTEEQRGIEGETVLHLHRSAWLNSQTWVYHKLNSTQTDAYTWIHTNGDKQMGTSKCAHTNTDRVYQHKSGLGWTQGDTEIPFNSKSMAVSLWVKCITFSDYSLIFKTLSLMNTAHLLRFSPSCHYW